MNDIDKEDLEHIAYCLKHVLELCETVETPSCKKFHLKNQRSLISKIENMIDDFCEHEWEITDYRHDRCIKCGVVN